MKKLIAGVLALMMAFSAFGVTTITTTERTVGVEYCAVLEIQTDDVVRTIVSTIADDGFTIITETVVETHDENNIRVRDADIIQVQTYENESVTHTLLSGNTVVDYAWTVRVTPTYDDAVCGSGAVPGGIVTTQNFAASETILSTVENLTATTVIDFVGTIVTRTVDSVEITVSCGAWVFVEAGIEKRICTEVELTRYEVTRE